MSGTLRPKPLWRLIHWFRPDRDRERPQRGRYRQFTQIGVEIVNPTEDYRQALVDLGEYPAAAGMRPGEQRPTDKPII